MSHSIIQRPEMASAMLELGGSPIDLADYATTGLRIVTAGPSGSGKTNAGLLIGEQLAEQGWVSVFVDPEGEIESLYGTAVADADALRDALVRRDQSILVVSARDASEFVPFGRAILDVADQHRRPVYLMLDEGQVFSAPRKRKEAVGEATDIVNEFAGRGRKRALDLFMTAQRFTGSLNRTTAAMKNLTLVGCQDDPAAWSSIAPLFRAAGLEFRDVASLGPGEFFCFSRRGCEKVKMPMAAALKRVAAAAKPVQPALPATFPQWDRAMRRIATNRLEALTDPVVALLGTIAGLTPQQMEAGRRALVDELESR